MLILLSLIITIIYFILNILDKGEIGDQGDKGSKGDIGNKGLIGSKGKTGRRGSMGEKGDFYYGSVRGPIGLTGDKGEQGEPGERGERGDRGDRGDRGKQGVEGDKGVMGDRGPTGIKGDKGENNILKFGVGDNIDKEKKLKTLNSIHELKYYGIDSGKEIGYKNAFSKFYSGVELDSANGNMNWNNVITGFKLKNEDEIDDRFSCYFTNIKITNV